MSEFLQLDSLASKEQKCSADTHAPAKPKNAITKAAKIGSRSFVDGRPQIGFLLGTAHGVKVGDLGYFYPDCSFTFRIINAEQGVCWADLDDKNLTRFDNQKGAFIHTTGTPEK